jgi:6-phosphogluconolactonase (cycloisomerase 2 family)
MGACGGGNTSGGGGGTPPPKIVEYLYATNTANQIFAISINAATGALTQTAVASGDTLGVGNLGIAIAPSGKFLYAANDVASGINGYSTNSSGTLSLIPGSPFLPLGPATVVFGGLAIDSGGKFLYAASQLGFGIVGFTIDSANGSLIPIPGGPFATGVGTPPGEIAIDPTGRFLYASTQIDDVVVPGHNVWAFKIDSSTGALALIAGSPFATLVNSQPVGLKVDPSGKFLYVALSNSGSVAAFAIDSTTGSLTAVAGSPFPTASTQFTQTSALSVSPSGRFLFAFNFHLSTVAAFTIDSNSGSLSPVTGSPFPTNPNGQGDLIVDPSGKFLYLAVGWSPTIGFLVFNIDPNTGALTPVAGSPFAAAQNPSGLAVVRFQ